MRRVAEIAGQMPIESVALLWSIEAGKSGQRASPESAFSVLKQGLHGTRRPGLVSLQWGDLKDDFRLARIQAFDADPAADPEHASHIFMDRCNIGRRKTVVPERRGTTGVKQTVSLFGPAQSSVPGANPECPIT